LPCDLDADKPQSVIVPAGATLVFPDLSAWREMPTRKTGIYRPATVAAFVSYVEQHLIPEIGTVWVHPTSGRVVAIFDDNSQEESGWREWQAVLELETTPSGTTGRRRTA